MLDRKQLQEIRAMLLITDTTFTDVAKELKVSRETLYKAVKNESDTALSKKIRAFIEEKVGHVEVWHIKNNNKQPKIITRY